MTLRRVCNREKVADELGAIGDLTRIELVERWTRIHRRPPPKGLSRRLLEYTVAYDVQAREYGGLKPAIRRKLRQRASGVEELARPAVAHGKAKSLFPGTRLMREWRGRTHRVDVLESGYLCDGKHYGSLSQIARAITGARWSGPRFFGVRRAVTRKRRT